VKASAARVRASAPDIPPHLNADRQETQVSAIVAYLNREEGLPVAMNKNVNASPTLENLIKDAAPRREKPTG
jgi:hypothetical protein